MKEPDFSTRHAFLAMGRQVSTQLDLQGAQAAIELGEITRSEDGRSYDRIVQQPGQDYISRLFAQIQAQLVVNLQLRLVSSD